MEKIFYDLKFKFKFKFRALISLQQRKHFIAIRALTDLASGNSADPNEDHTYHYGRNAKLSRTKLF